MRMSKIHKIVVTAVVTTIATATVLTFTRGDSAADRVASLPETGNDSPVVASRTPGATTKPTPTPSATTPSPEDDPATQAPKPATAETVKPSTKTTKPPAPTTEPAPSPTPSPREKSLIEILLGQ